MGWRLRVKGSAGLSGPGIQVEEEIHKCVGMCVWEGSRNTAIPSSIQNASHLVLNETVHPASAVTALSNGSGRWAREQKKMEVGERLA